MIYVMRHATAEAAGARPDADRRLTESGRAEAVVAGRALAALGARVARVITSPLLRARETAELVAVALATRAGVDVDGRLASGTTPDRIWETVVDGEAEGVLAVGHNPELGLLAGSPLSPSAVVCFESDGGRPSVVWIRTPAELATLAR